jgi:hypothetical protein
MPSDGGAGPDRPDYWLAYWLAAYAHVHAARGPVRPLGYERWCAAPREVTGALAEALGLRRGAGFERAVARVHAPPPARAEAADFDAALVERARDLYRSLLAA